MRIVKRTGDPKAKQLGPHTSHMTQTQGVGQPARFRIIWRWGPADQPLHLATRDAHWLSKDGIRSAKWLNAEVCKVGTWEPVSCLMTDKASVMQKAKRLCIEDLRDPPSSLCIEHLQKMLDAYDYNHKLMHSLLPKAATRKCVGKTKKDREQRGA